MQFTETDSRSRQSLESTLARDTDSLEIELSRETARRDHASLCVAADGPRVIIRFNVVRSHSLGEISPT